MKENIISGNDFASKWKKDRPARIVSLVPSLTEIFYFFGLNEKVVGITKFCVLPYNKVPKPKGIGGTKNPSIDRIKLVHPDIIFANKEENNLSDVEALSEFCPIIVTDIRTVEDNITVLDNIGRLFDLADLSSGVSDQLMELYPSGKINNPRTAIYLIWNRPLMTAGGDTFINEMMHHAGFDNLFKNETRYPITDESVILKLNPEFILLSSEPYPFKEKDLILFREKFPGSKILIVDGQMFSWYGIRPLFAADYFKVLQITQSQ